ncbi:MAG TPA: ATP-binding protein [Caulobacteraceae bacterium]|nr:ATP-binding protein [Caulobacteraceae bacterium]
MALLERLAGIWKAQAPGIVRSEPMTAWPNGKTWPEGGERRNGAFPHFRLTAGDQNNPLLRDGLADVRSRLRNAFTPSQPMNDRNLFAGRTALLASVIRAIEDERLHVVIYGQRGIGKTSVMHILAQTASEARYRLTYVSCGASSNFDETFRLISQSVPLLFHSAYGPTSPEAEKGATFADLLSGAAVTPRVAADLLAKLTGTRLIVMLDEFDRVESAEFRLRIAEFIKTLSDRLVRVHVVIAGVAANVAELLAYTPSIQRGLFAVEAPPMTEDEIRLLVKLGQRATGISFEEVAIDCIVTVADGLPYLASLLSHHAALAALDDGRIEVTKMDVAAALDRTIRDFENRIPQPLRKDLDGLLNENRLQILGVLAKQAQADHGEFTLATSAASTIESAEWRQSLVSLLIAEGVLTEQGESGGQTRFRFVEDSLPNYLWLAASRSRMRTQPFGAVSSPALHSLDSVAQ